MVLEVKEHNGKVQLQVALPDVSGPTADDIAATHPDGSTARFKVTGLTANGGRAFLVTSAGVAATITADKVGKEVGDPPRSQPQR